MRTLVTFGLGALAMYLLDPEQGRRRRALLRDRWAHAKRLMPMEARRPVSSQLEAQKPAESPAGARHLGR